MSDTHGLLVVGPTDDLDPDLVRELLAAGWRLRIVQPRPGEAVVRAEDHDSLAQLVSGPRAGRPRGLRYKFGQTVPSAAGVRMRFVPVPPGLWVGPNGELVAIDDMWMADFPVTNGAWCAFTDASCYDGTADCPGLDIYRVYDGSYLKALRDARPGFCDPDRPVVCVSWLNAMAFAGWLTNAERRAGAINESYEYRLPTEIEWEYIAAVGRAESTGALLAPGTANFDGTIGGPTPCGAFPPNLWGAYDTLGNVFEWCANRSGAGWLHHVAAPEAQGNRANRGGSWASPPESCRPVYRHWNDPASCHDRLGFRLVLAPCSEQLGATGRDS